MANTIKRDFRKTRADKANLANANVKGASCPNPGTEFVLTGNFDVDDGWLDSKGNKQNTDRQYAYFEGKRNGKDVPAGISAGVFLRRPFDGFTEEEEATLTEFHKELLNCLSAEEFFDLMESKNAWGKTIVVTRHTRHTEKPFGSDTEKPVRYAIFDIK